MRVFFISYYIDCPSFGNTRGLK